MEDLINKIKMPRENRGLVGSADGKRIFLREEADVRLNHRGRVHGAVLSLQCADEGGAVGGIPLPRFQGLLKTNGVRRMGIEWPQRIRLVQVVVDDTGKIAGLING